GDGYGPPHAISVAGSPHWSAIAAEMGAPGDRAVTSMSLIAPAGSWIAATTSRTPTIAPRPHDVGQSYAAAIVVIGYRPGPAIVSGSRHVSCDGALHAASSTLPSQLSSLPLPHTSGRSELTVGSLSSQSWPPMQWASGSPSPSTSRGACLHDCVG